MIWRPWIFAAFAAGVVTGGLIAMAATLDTLMKIRDGRDERGRHGP